MIRPISRFVVDTAHLYCVYSRTHVGPAVILQSGRYVEKAKTPEHCPFHRRHNGSFANRFGVDAERNSDGVHRGKSNQPGEPFRVIILRR